jgi:4'-phosphopantetheinyl transferase
MSGAAAVAVHPWPAAQQAAALALTELGLAVIGVELDAAATRDVARHSIRHALADTLALACHCPLAQVQLQSEPAQPVRVTIPGHRLALSLSHETGLSLAAIRVGGAVGIDVMRIDEELDWKPVARLYLGTSVSAEIGCKPRSRQAYFFAQAWTAWEASLKCCGLAISEWNPALAGTLAQCRVQALEVPAGFAGSVAVLDEALSPAL